MTTMSKTWFVCSTKHRRKLSHLSRIVLVSARRSSRPWHIHQKFNAFPNDVVSPIWYSLAIINILNEVIKRWQHLLEMPFDRSIGKRDFVPSRFPAVPMRMVWGDGAGKTVRISFKRRIQMCVCQHLRHTRWIRNDVRLPRFWDRFNRRLKIPHAFMENACYFRRLFLAFFCVSKATQGKLESPTLASNNPPCLLRKGVLIRRTWFLLDLSRGGVRKSKPTPKCIFYVGKPCWKAHFGSFRSSLVVPFLRFDIISMDLMKFPFAFYRDWGHSLFSTHFTIWISFDWFDSFVFIVQ